MESKQPPKTGSLVVLFITLALLAAFQIPRFERTLSVSRACLATSGKVLSNEDRISYRSAGKPVSAGQVVYSFEVENKRYVGLERLRELPPGREVPVLYSPENPEESYLGRPYSVWRYGGLARKLYGLMLFFLSFSLGLSLAKRSPLAFLLSLGLTVGLAGWLVPGDLDAVEPGRVEDWSNLPRYTAKMTLQTSSRRASLVISTEQDRFLYLDSGWSYWGSLSEPSDVTAFHPEFKQYFRLTPTRLNELGTKKSLPLTDAIKNIGYYQVREVLSSLRAEPCETCHGKLGNCLSRDLSDGRKEWEHRGSRGGALTLRHGWVRGKALVKRHVYDPALGLCLSQRSASTSEKVGDWSDKLSFHYDMQLSSIELLEDWHWELPADYEEILTDSEFAQSTQALLEPEWMPSGFQLQRLDSKIDRDLFEGTRTQSHTEIWRKQEERDVFEIWLSRQILQAGDDGKFAEPWDDETAVGERSRWLKEHGLLMILEDGAVYRFRYKGSYNKEPVISSEVALRLAKQLVEKLH